MVGRPGCASTCSRTSRTAPAGILTIAMLLIMVGAVELQILSGVNGARGTHRLQRKTKPIGRSSMTR